ncbi:MAG: PIN domain-containing protein [Armatimonadota bacterium]|nr:PIN domain-containing protein [Armatimonadota bacterium]MDR7448134.1 PIN domain-containing protein [Armatimonadota bacterium]MDR7527033.1 PIN domain-containing protein [Armatimonadota bacterium]
MDTSALYALLDRDDQVHRAAAATWAGLLRAGDPLLTHNYVLVETTALLQRRLGTAAVQALRDDLLPVLSTVWVDENVHEMALTALIAARDREVSLVDRVSFECMRRRGVRRAFAFDRHFADQGFEVIPEGAAR